MVFIEIIYTVYTIYFMTYLSEVRGAVMVVASCKHKIYKLASSYRVTFKIITNFVI